MNLAVKIGMNTLRANLEGAQRQQEFESMYGVNSELFDMADEMLRPQCSGV